MAGLQDKVMIEVGLNEGQMRTANPNVPYSPAEIARDARACYDAGASVVHYHGRDPATGAPRSNDPEVNIEAQRLITESTPLIAYPTYATHVRVLDYYDVNTSAQDRYRHFIAGLSAGVKFEIGPIDLGSAIDRNARWDARSGQWIPTTGVQLNTGADHRWLASFCQKHGLKPSFAVFDSMHILNLGTVVDWGLAGPAPLLVKLFLAHGNAAPKTLLFLLDRLKDILPQWRTCWMPVSTGSDQLPLAALALALGGHVRVGIGDYSYAEQGAPANAHLVERAVTVARAMGREPATPGEARELLGIDAAKEGRR